ncbi:jg11704 [Pararge aegeria aegeria]|uniref:Jg11704 protein n=1 Tax=Pararge aegeria aegeria TaxID=348720 RepID=A0A8S4RZX8_9NEOP|nr:jg11704 [Pararge aegeria aegeria]
MDVGVPRCWNGSPELVSAALFGPQLVGHTTLSASQVDAGSKRLRTVELGTPYKRPMSSSGRLSVDVMMMMRMIQINTQIWDPVPDPDPDPVLGIEPTALDSAFHCANRPSNNVHLVKT